MACDNCDHTMQSIPHAHWCPRCGSLKMYRDKLIFEKPTCRDLEDVAKVLDDALVGKASQQRIATAARQLREIGDST